MLVEFSVTNFLSIREKVSLSLLRGQGSELEESNVLSVSAPNTPDVLSSAVLFGANSAGKSNLIKALLVMQNLIKNSAKIGQLGERLEVTPFRFDDYSDQQPSEFEITFVADKVRYQYGFSLDQERVREEWLYAYPSGRPQRWIERIFDSETGVYVWGSMGKLSGKKQLWQESTRANALFLSTAVQLNNQQLKSPFEWLSNKLRIGGLAGWGMDSLRLCEEGGDGKRDVLRFLTAADLNISDLDVQKKNFDSEDLPSTLPDEIREELIEKLNGQSLLNVKTVHVTDNGQRVLLDLSDESDGTQKLFALAGPWLQSLEQGYTLVIDELQDNLHPLMVKFLVQLFHSPESNAKQAQLIFTTHDTSILDQEVFRRDQIWFCEKDPSQVSHLVPLTDFKPRKGVENIEKGYLSGRYGASPYLRGLDLGR
ncbi:MAG: ATP-binding protein [Gammaproteobacteria bacterium]|nr:ATP-binding protein [Gammaproteobacteria bacterium]